MKMTPLVAAIVLTASACAGTRAVAPAAEPTTSSAEPDSTLQTASEVRWEPLNPARGDASPMAATLWGDRNGSGPTGFLFRPVDGFRSPPHIHNVSYRGVVIRGLIHNDEPQADERWMPAGSFWTQPRGSVHITAARGSDILAYIEIDEGPHLVRPVEEAFSSEDEPMNIDASSIAWVDLLSVFPGEPFVASTSAEGPEVALLWGDPGDDQPSGILFKLATGSAIRMRSHASTLRLVTIQGRQDLREADEAGIANMEPGGYLGSTRGSEVHVSCNAGTDCIVYVRAEGRLEVVAVDPV